MLHAVEPIPSAAFISGRMANREALDRLFADPGAATEHMQRAVREALREHKLLGHSIIVWQDGRVVELPPEEIPVDVSLTSTGRQAKAPAPEVEAVQ